jgi:CubicO group peptidase (beta-lactamase class C family)
MHSTWFNVPEDLHHLIVSYGIKADSGFSEYQRIPIRKVTAYSGGSGLFSSPNDYLKFIHCILNDGAYDYGYILKPETIKQLFSNELSDNHYLTLSVPEDDFNPNEGVGNSTDRHSLAWALAKGHGYGLLKNDTEPVLDNYRKGIGYWSGIYNTYFSINPNHGYSTVTFHQFLPYGDEDAIRLYLMFEQEVHKSIVQEQR